MFTFDAIENSLYNGTSPDNVSDAIKNRFTMFFGSPALNGRLQVKLSENQIRFFYYDSDYPEKKENAQWDPNGVKDNDYFGEVGFITLTRPKDMGNDILAFPQNIGELELYDVSSKKSVEKQEKGIWESVVDSIENCREVFYDFPFIDEIKGDKFAENKKAEISKWDSELEGKKRNGDDKEIVRLKEQIHPEKKNLFRCFLRCCLLDFIYEFEDRWQSFGSSPLYDTVRDKLRESDVYKMLTAKIHYKQYLYKGKHLAGNKEKYTYYAQKFADCLMNSRTNKVIFYQNYYSKATKDRKENTNIQGWFYNPEEELEKILYQNRQQERADNAVLEENLVLKICNFLYTKHAVYQALTKDKSKQLFNQGQALMCITSTAIICSSIFIRCADLFLHVLFPLAILLYYFQKRPKGGNIFLYESDGKNYKLARVVQTMLIFSILLLGISILSLFCNCPIVHTLVIYAFYVTVIVSIVVCLIDSGRYNTPDNGGLSGVVYSFFPRILVAELAAWLTIGIAEDLVKSMLWVSEWWKLLAAVVLVFGLIIAIVAGEIKQHSPYLSRRAIIKRDIEIINHSLFFALGIGVLMQFVFYNNLVKNSDVISNVVYSDYFDKANYYCQNLEDLNQITEQHKDYCNQVDLKNISLLGEGKSTQIYHINDSTDVVTTIRIKNKTVNDSLNDKPQTYNDIVCCYNKVVDEIKQLYTCDSLKVDTSMFFRLDKMPLDSSNDTINVRIRDANSKKIDSFPSFLQAEISNVRRNILKFNNYDTLMAWSTVGYDNNIETGSAYLDTLTRKAIEDHVCCREIINCKVISEDLVIRIFPYLLIFHTLIVLVIAFVLQLLITDKTVTEPL